MELKTAADNILTEWQCENFSQIGEKIMAAIAAGDLEPLFEKYKKAVGGDMDTDYIRKCFQFWKADRGTGSKQQDYTPESLGKLVARLAVTEEAVAVYDCCAGSGALTMAAFRRNPNAHFVCEELDETVIPFLLFNLAIRGINAVVIRGDILKNERYQYWNVRNTGEYSEVTPMDSYREEKYDACISNPPFNIPWEPEEEDGLFSGGDSRFPIMPPKSNANYAFVFHCLSRMKPGGRACFILPNGVLTEGGKGKEIRKYLVDHHLVRYAITMPDSMFESTGVPVCLLGIQHGEEIPALIDARESGHDEIREQRGEDHARARVYKKRIRVFSDEEIEQIAAVVEHRKGKYIALPATEDDIEKAEYSLSAGRYMNVQPELPEHRPYVDIINDLNRIAQERGKVKLTINETLAKKLGLYDVAQLEKQSQKNTDNINEALGQIKGLDVPKLEHHPYIALSKNAGEMKIENKDKKGISSIYQIFMPMYRQHLFYLNEEENRLLAELRDAMLPEFMAGKLEFSEGTIEAEKSENIEKQQSE